MTNNQLVEANIKDRLKTEETVKSEVDNILSGLKLKSIKGIQEQLLSVGVDFLDQYIPILKTIGQDGEKLANAISGNKNNQDKKAI